MLLSHITALFLYINVHTLQIPVPALYNTVALPHVIVNILHIAVYTLHINVGNSICGVFRSLLYSSPQRMMLRKKALYN